MPIQWSEDSFKVKEETKWNRPKREGGYNADGYEEFPRMLYKAQQNPLSGKYEVFLRQDVISADKTVVILSAEQFNTSCQLIVKDEAELQRALADGWRKTKDEAEAYAEHWLDGIARAAAERAYQDRNMSDKAKAEVAEAESKTANHLPEIKAKPLRA